MVIFFTIFTLMAAVKGHEKCYDHFGCFDDKPPFNEPLVQLPEDPANLNTKFYLYTQKNKNVYQELDPLDNKTVSASNYDGSKRTVMALHGYLGNSEEVWVRGLIDALLEREDMNVIFVDWRKGSNFPYHQAVGTARVVGAQLTRMVQTLMKQHHAFNLLDFHCIGFSLGSHVCGYVGRNFKRLQKTIGRITALDPAGPYFEKRHIDVRLDPTDASFVDVIHSDTKRLGVLVNWVGTDQALGHIDFYPNGGYDQPGCRILDSGIFQFFACSHFRSMTYFTESINNRHCPSRAYPCQNYQDFEDALCRTCSTDGCPSMGYNSVEHQGKLTGKYYLETFDKKPFCAHHYNIEFNTASKLAGDLNGRVYITITGSLDVSEQIEIPGHYYPAGSKHKFVILTRKNLGNLLKVKVSHSAWVDIWHLESVIIRPMWTNNAYTGCYMKWLNSNDNEVNLHTGQAGYCTSKVQ